MVQTLTTSVQTMSPENFCYWLQGLFELQPDLKELTPAQIDMIKQHLMYVFGSKQQPAIQFNPPPGQPYPMQSPPLYPGLQSPFMPDLGITVVC